MGCAPIIPAIPLEYAESLSYMEWLISLTKQVNNISELISGNIDNNLKEYIDSRFDNLMLNATYDAETETIFLKKGTMKG